MSTSDQFLLRDSLEKLQAISDLTSQYSRKEKPKQYDKIVIMDPFDREQLIKKVPTDIRADLRRLIDHFEKSLERLFTSGIILSREAIIRNYRCMIEKEIQLALDKRGRPRSRSVPDPEPLGYGGPEYMVNHTAITVPEPSSLEQSSSDDQDKASTPSKKRTPIPKETRDLLEKIFETKRTPNSKERKIIAEKCGLSALQVRVWFTNKRMRSKS